MDITGRQRSRTQQMTCTPTAGAAKRKSSHLSYIVEEASGASTYTYSYDGLGRRVKMVDPSATSYFMYSGSKMLYSKVGVTETAYIYLGDRLLVRKEGTGTTPEARYYHQDLSTNVRL